MATQVLGLYELVERILLQLPSLEILAAKAVCTSWNKVINSSTPLKQAIFRAPAGQIIRTPEHSQGPHDISGGKVPPWAWTTLRMNPIFEDDAGVRFLQRFGSRAAHSIIAPFNGIHLNGMNYLLHWTWGWDGASRYGDPGQATCRSGEANLGKWELWLGLKIS